MRRFGKYLLFLISFMWLVGLAPVESRACSSTMQNDRCCAAEPVCSMDCCRVPGNLYSSDIPVAGTLPQVPAAPVALKTPVLNSLVAPETVVALDFSAPTFIPAALPEKIYLLHRALLI